ADNQIIEPFAVSKLKPQSANKNITLRENTHFRKLILVSILCNEASLNCPTPDLLPEQQENAAVGDPTETALLVSAVKSGFDVEQVRMNFKKLREYPFDAAAKRMTTILETADAEVFAGMKG